MQEDNFIFSNTSNDARLNGVGKTFFHNSLVHIFILFIVLFNIASWGVLLFFIRVQQTTVILHYNIYFGIDLVGDRAQAFMIPSAGAVFFVINLLLAKWFYDNKKRIISYLLLLSALVVEFGAFVASVSIALINY